MGAAAEPRFLDCLKNPRRDMEVMVIANATNYPAGFANCFFLERAKLQSSVNSTGALLEGYCPVESLPPPVAVACRTPREGEDEQEKEKNVC